MYRNRHGHVWTDVQHHFKVCSVQYFHYEGGEGIIGHHSFETPPPIYTHHIFSRVEKSKKAHRINKHGLVAAVVQSRHKTVMAGVYN